MKTLQVGQTLYSLNVGNAARNCPQTLSPCTVTKIGRKYFEVTFEGYHRPVIFHVDSWTEKTEYTSNYCLYESPQAWKDEVESKQCCRMIYENFEYGQNRAGLTLAELRVICTLLEKANENAVV